MAKTISLDVEQIRRLNTEISALDSTLLGNYLPNLSSTLDAVNTNLLSDEVNATLLRITSQVESVKSSLSVGLPKLEDFLYSQLSEYSINEETASEALKATIEKMNTLLGVAGSTVVGTSSTISADDTLNDVSSTETDPYAHGWGEKYTETWSSWWNDVREAYSDTHGLFSAVGNTAEAVLDTAGALIETVGNGISDALHSVGNAIGWILG